MNNDALSLRLPRSDSFVASRVITLRLVSRLSLQVFRQWAFAAVLVVVVVTAGCSTESGLGPARTTTTTDPYAVPDVIDAAYLNRVMAKLAEVKVVAVRDTVNSGGLTPDAQRRLEAIYSGPALESQLRQARGPLPEGLPTIDESTPPDRFTVTEIKQATPTCVWFDASYVAGVLSDSGEATIVLRRTARDVQVNPTPWTQDVTLTSGEPTMDEKCR